MKKRPDFELDDKKDKRNQHKHCVSFALAQIEFLDVNRVILEDLEHSDKEARYYLGKVAGGIMTVRFTYRNRLPELSRQGRLLSWPGAPGTGGDFRIPVA